MGWVSQATEKVSEAATQALQPIEKGLSQGITDLGRTIANSPALEAVITYIAATNGVPPEATAAFLAANKTSQTGGNLEKGLETLVLSYGAGKFAAYQPVSLDKAAIAVETGAPVNSAVAAAQAAATGATPMGANAAGSLFSGTGAASLPMGANAAGSLFTGAEVATPLMGANAAGSLFSGAESAAIPMGANAAGSLFSGAATGAAGAAAAAGAAGAAGAGGLAAYGPALVTGGLGVLGSSLSAEKAREAAQTQAQAQVEAARIAAEAAKFRPVGVTTRFGTSQFTTDAQGNVIGAGYAASPEIKAYQDRLSALAAQGLTGAERAPAAYAPLTAGAQSLFNLGQGYIQETPEQQAAAYIAKQQALLAPGQEQQLAQLQTKLQAQGRGGLSVAQGGSLSATSPELAAYYNALAQSNLQLAAQGQQAGQQQATFGAGLLGAGSDLMGKYYSGQTAAYAPFATAIDTSTGLESLAQQPLTLGTQIGAKTTAASAEAGRLIGQGLISSAATQAPANAFSYGGNILSQFGSNPQFTNALNKSFGVTDPNQVAMQNLLSKIYGV